MSIRALLLHVKVEFVDDRLKKEKFDKLMEERSLESDDVPLWIDEHGREFCHQTAILRLLGSQYGITTHDPLVAYEVDWYFSTCSDHIDSGNKGFRAPWYHSTVSPEVI